MGDTGATSTRATPAYGASTSTPELPPDWQQALSSHGFSTVDVQAAVAAAYGQHRGSQVLPAARDEVFRAFHATPLASVRVVILGQDPYYSNPIEADGLAFSARRLPANATALPPALNTIFRNLEATAAHPSGFAFSRPARGDLTPWAKEGVLLLNTALTVAQGCPASHLSLWRGLTDAVLKVIRGLPEPTALMLWGGKAQRRGRHARSTPEIFQMPHPSARAERIEWLNGSRYPFLEVSEFISSHGRGSVCWSL